jgi:hypothetical protein
MKQIKKDFSKEDKKSLKWWGNLTDTQKLENRNKVTILDGRTWQNLTGREIEMIWRNCA